MRLRSYVLVFLAAIGVQVMVYPAAYRRAAPRVGDAAEVLNIAVSLAHGRGYALDWTSPDFRRAYAGQAGRGRGEPAGPYDFILLRRGPPHATLSRPPLMPALVAACVWVCPDPGDVFLIWRAVDLTACAAAVSLLAGAVIAAGGGRVGLLALGVVFVGDPVRWAYIPGWWTEGLAFDGVAVVCWLLTVGPATLHRPWLYRVAAGAVIGLLCLDRAAFVLMLAPLCLLLADGGRWWSARRLQSAAIIAAVAIAVQVPWWARNVAVAGGRLVPLGTQGGFNLPDEYGPAAVAADGVWTGEGITAAWLASGHADLHPPGYTEAQIAALLRASRPFAALIVAFSCTSTADELAVADVGQRAAARWVRANPGRVPGLVLAKAWSLSAEHRGLLSAAAAAVGVGLWRSPRHRRPLALLVAVILAYGVTVALTHVVVGRFLVPALPAAYAAVSVAVAAIVRPGRTGTPAPRRVA